jgi:mannosyltransferase OCH1-like enzyme
MDLIKTVDLPSLIEKLPKKWTPTTATIATLTGLYFLWRLKRQIFKKDISGPELFISEFRKRRSDVSSSRQPSENL